MTIEGIDYAFSVPSAAAVAAAGKRFVVRYGGPGSAGKQLTAGELADLTAHGIAVVANAEGAAGGFRGAAAGRAWAGSAEQHFRDLGMPVGRPIYFSVDWFAGPGDWADVDAALRGAASVIGADRVGVYGGYATIEHCAAAGTARWFWQTYAWSAGRWSAHCHLQQYRNGVTIGAVADCDLDRAMQSDYGQWGADMPVNRDDVNTIFNTDGVITAPPPAAQDGFWSAAQFLRNGYNEAKAAHASADQIATAIAALAKEVTAVQTTLAGLTPALLGALVPAIVAALPAGVTVTEEQLAAAIVAALKQLAA